MGRLDGKVALITGAGSGIGRAAARLFTREGARVVVAEIQEAAGRETVESIRAAGGTAELALTDVTRESQVAAAVKLAVERFGALHVLYNCAGGSIPQDSWVDEVDMSVWDHTINLDLKGMFHACRHAIPAIVRAGGGAVVNMSSGAALRGSSPAHVYTAAKGAILSLTRALAGRYAKNNVRVNAICAGRILTERILSTYGTDGRPGPVVDRQNSSERVKDYPFWVGRPEDIAAIALFLASEESRMITGASIPADGGRSSY